ncbi:MAG: outer membrane beta-barrel protein [Bacteroidota bacterium]
MLVNNYNGLRTGISYSRKGFKLVYAWITPNGGNGTGDTNIPLESSFRLKYIDIPLCFYYQLVSKKRFHISPSFGIMNSINIGKTEISEMGDGSIKQTSFSTFNANPYMLGVRLGIINDFGLSDKIFISLEPYVTYNFSKINETDIQKSDLIFGGYLSVNYRFNKI